jgi:hypothetical protein
MKTSNDVMVNIPLPDPKLERGRYVATIVYQIPNRILLQGRRKVSPRFDTLYGIIYWLNKQPYHMDYIVLKTDKNTIVRQGSKKIGETIK